MDTSIQKIDSQLLKGWAVFLMVSGHLLTTNWIVEGIELIDVWVSDEPFTGVFLNAVNCCVHIFAFLTGYVWNQNYASKNKYVRILDVYCSYWISLLFVTPCYIFGGGYQPTSVSRKKYNLFYELLGVDSEISRFNWYILFFSLAVLTYPIWMKLVRRIEKHVYVAIVTIIAMGLIMRLVGRGIYKFEIIDVTMLSVLSRYFSTMPSILIGTIVNKHKLFDTWNQKLGKNQLCVSVMVFVALAGINIFTIYILNISSNLDSVWIIFYMWATNNLFKELKAESFIFKILLVLGKFSLYIWLIHCVFFWVTIQPYTYLLRVPLLVIITVLVISLLVSLVIRKIDILAKSVFNSIGKRI